MIPPAMNDSVRLFQPRCGSTSFENKALNPWRCCPCCQANICQIVCFWKSVASLNSHWSEKKMLTAYFEIK